MAETVIPLFTCPIGAYGHHCDKGRGHPGGQHQCRCGQYFTAAPTRPIPHHDWQAIDWPESSAA